MTKLNAIIIGASGYTAVELIRIILNHPNIKIKALVGNSAAGKSIAEIYPHLAFADLPIIQKFTETDFANCDVVFSCLPHMELQNYINDIPKDKKIIDVSADFRLQNLELFKEFYGDDHKAPQHINEAVYGLTEINKDKLKDARIIACPGCYPTSILLPIIPLAKNNKLSDNNIIADSKSGISGAGRKLATGNLFAEVNENCYPYAVEKHRHLSEMKENIGEKFNIQFTPHIIPTNRGIVSTIYVNSNESAEDLKGFLNEFYNEAPFIRIIDGNQSPNIKNINGTNYCDINIFESSIPNQKIIISAIDNLCKGSSGQAIQNFNIAFGFDEKTGLEFQTIYP